MTLSVVACRLIGFAAWSQTNRAGGVSLTTHDRIQAPGWWPTKGVPARNEYRGPAACATCHADKVRTQSSTPMASAATPAADAELLRQHGQLEFISGAYNFQISAAADGPVYSVSEGTNSLRQALAWAFGAGEVGQTYVFQRDARFYESRVSFYPALEGLDLTLGHHAPLATDLAGALGRAMTASETQLCFGCHTTASTTGGRFDVADLIAGVTCEACHGPGAKHIAAMRQGEMKRGLQLILNPRKLNPSDSVDFCGACHRTAWDVALANPVGIANVRFQPYRLEKSRCWGRGDVRLTCMACHDPHQPLVRNAEAYDKQCLSCHRSKIGAVQGAAPAVAGDHPGKACPLSANRCVTCHMPKYEIPGSHAQFTDHWIRTVRPDSDYPD